MILNEIIKSYNLVLASASPRRIDLMRGMGFEFTIRPLDADESYPPSLKGSEIAVYLSRKKSEAFPETELQAKTVVITADTIVWQHNRALEKPFDRNHAIEMLKSLSAAEHEVFTGVTLRSLRKSHSFFNRSLVKFRELSIEEMEYYVDTCKPFDKAGSYGVQEWIGYVAIERIEGSYFNVMGLPTRVLYQELGNFVD
ncbi:MAG: septum formation protein Maf [Bacteroidetes bacterium HGW-Bacteroidetes-6]|nr:MAG: septum formation protein Maf [Bacteroidetes bacterium HGW-Bacteroidetes-6]